MTKQTMTALLCKSSTFNNVTIDKDDKTAQKKNPSELLCILMAKWKNRAFSW